MKPSGILNFENVPADADDPDVKVYVNGELVETGGGDSSDFTTAVVTSDDTTYQISMLAPVAMDEEGMSASFVIETLDIGASITVILYKGYAVIPVNLSDDDTLDVTGDGVYNEDTKMLFVTGNCTIHTRGK